MSSRRKNVRPAKGYGFLPWLRKRFKLLGLSVIVVAATSVVSVSLYFYQFLSQGLARVGARSGVLGNYGQVDANHDFNLVLFKIKDFADPTSLIDSLWLLNFQVKKGKLNLLSIPMEQALPTIKGSGKVKVAALYGLSRLNGDEEMARLSKTLSLSLGLPVDGVFYSDEVGFQKLSQIFGGRLDSLDQSWPAAKSLVLLKSFFLLGSAYKTNLDGSSFVNFLGYLNFHFPTNIRTFTASNIDDAPERLDLILRANFMDSEVEAERLKIIVLNGAGKTGLAYSLGRLSSNLGLSVLSTGNAEAGQINADSVLISRSQNYYSVARLMGILGIKDLRLFDEPGVAGNPQLSRLLRGDLVLILGKDQIE